MTTNVHVPTVFMSYLSDNIRSTSVLALPTTTDDDHNFTIIHLSFFLEDEAHPFPFTGSSNLGRFSQQKRKATLTIEEKRES